MNLQGLINYQSTLVPDTKLHESHCYIHSIYLTFTVTEPSRKQRHTLKHQISKSAQHSDSERKT